MDDRAAALLAWYDRHRRQMPWRDVGNPYATWVSETMLQQTRVETVLSYYDRFLRAFPTVEALAAADEADVLKLWEGLGYYSRARNLLAGARQVTAEYGGVLPSDVPALRKIRGIGPYTAGAIASLAYGKPEPAVDGNVTRVLSRLTGYRENAASPSGRREVEARVRALIPAERPGDFNQALMDLGATVCVPGTPDCDRCPLAAFCDASAAGDADELPVLPQKNPPRAEVWDVLLIRSGNRFLLRRRTESLLHGLWVFAMAEGHGAEADIPKAARRLTGLSCRHPTDLGEARHVFTHRVWEMRVWSLETDAEVAPEGWVFADTAEMDRLTLPSAMRRARQLAGEIARGLAETVSGA